MGRFWALVQWVIPNESLNTVDVVCIDPKKYGNEEIVTGQMILLRKKGASNTRMAKILEISGDKFRLLRQKRQINSHQKRLQYPARQSIMAPNIDCAPKTEQEQVQVHIPSSIQQVYIDEEDVLEQVNPGNSTRIYESYASTTMPRRNPKITDRQPVYIDEEIVVESPINNGRHQLQTVFLDEGSDGEHENQPVTYRHSRRNTIRNQFDDAGGLDDFLGGVTVYIDDDYIIMEQPPGLTCGKSTSKSSRLSQRPPVSFDFPNHHPTNSNFFDNMERADLPQLSGQNTQEYTLELGVRNNQPLITPSDLFEEPQTQHVMICSTPMPKFIPDEYNNTHQINQSQPTESLESKAIIHDMRKQIQVLSSSFCEFTQSTVNKKVESCFPREVFNKMADMLGKREIMIANATSDAENLPGSADASVVSTNVTVVGDLPQARATRARRVTAQLRTVHNSLP